MGFENLIVRGWRGLLLVVGCWQLYRFFFSPFIYFESSEGFKSLTNKILSEAFIRFFRFYMLAKRNILSFLMKIL